uniref:Uncharacterized protein n=1 Tax=Macaca mulatta TaxID=9544 RepID=A0A5F7ZHP7_MACMU
RTRDRLECRVKWLLGRAWCHMDGTGDPYLHSWPRSMLSQGDRVSLVCKSTLHFTIFSLRKTDKTNAVQPLQRRRWHDLGSLQPVSPARRGTGKRRGSFLREPPSWSCPMASPFLIPFMGPGIMMGVGSLSCHKSVRHMSLTFNWSILPCQGTMSQIRHAPPCPVCGTQQVMGCPLLGQKVLRRLRRHRSNELPELQRPESCCF